MKILWLASVLFGAAASTSSDVWCKNDKGNNVEWSVIYKAPNRLSSASSTASQNQHHGSEYGYIDSQMIATGLSNFSYGVNGIFSEILNPLANSLTPIFKWNKAEADKELVYIAYNDQPPSENVGSVSSGHTKGVVVFNSQTGIWLVHSVPKFPQKLFSGNYSLPENAHVNGQTLLCMTFNAQSLEVIVSHLLNQRAEIFESNAPERFLQQIPGLKLLLEHKFPPKEIPVLKSVLRGVSGTPFVAFAKSGALHDDVYSVTLAPALDSDLLVSSWQNGEGGKLGPECSEKFKVLDVRSVSFRFGARQLAWLTEHDHAKWAVGRNDSKWLCIGSINRMHSQFNRGGETVCFAEQKAAQLFLNAVTDEAKCNGTIGRL